MNATTLSRATRRPSLFRIGGAAALTTVALAMTGCNNAGQGAVSGGIAGALVGLGIGALSGNEGDGAAIGALSGAALGAVIGDQNRRADQRSGYYGNRPYYQDSYGGGGYYYNDAPRYRGREYCP